MEEERVKKLEDFDKRTRPVWVILIVVAIILYFATDGFKESSYFYAIGFIGIPASILMFFRDDATRILLKDRTIQK